jgi:methylated-DNA-[protein]-cysteine S-methyltransferase
MTYAPHMTKLATPIGVVTITGDAAAIHSVRLSAGGDEPAPSGTVPPLCPDDSPTMAAAAQIREYFDGTRRIFDLPLVPLDSARGQHLRAAIASIPYGSTATYGALARAHDSGARAMGGACRLNPYPIIIPCHRVTSSNGAAENYSGGRGAPTKLQLIAHEARHSDLFKPLI